MSLANRCQLCSRGTLIYTSGGVENPDLLDLELGCNLGSVPATYLGIPIGTRHKSTKVWDVVGENFRKRLALWKRQYIANEA